MNKTCRKDYRHPQDSATLLYSSIATHWERNPNMPVSKSASEPTSTDYQLAVHASHAVRGLALSTLLGSVRFAGHQWRHIYADVERSFQKDAAITARMALRIVPLCVLLPPLISTVRATDKTLRYRKQEVLYASLGACFTIVGASCHLVRAGVKPPAPLWLLGIGYAAAGCYMIEFPYQIYHFFQK